MPISSAPFRKLGKWWNVLSYRIGYLLISALEHRYLSDWRKENDMAKRRVRLRPDYDVKGKQVPVIYAMSPTLVPRPEDWADNIHMSGFWWDERPVDYKPDPALAEFLRAGDEPVYIGFGSMVSGDMGELAEIIRQAVKLSGVRAVVALGWGQQEAKTKDANIFYVKVCRMTGCSRIWQEQCITAARGRPQPACAMHCRRSLCRLGAISRSGRSGCTLPGAGRKRFRAIS